MNLTSSEMEKLLRRCGIFNADESFIVTDAQEARIWDAYIANDSGDESPSTLPWNDHRAIGHANNLDDELDRLTEENMQNNTPRSCLGAYQPLTNESSEDDTEDNDGLGNVPLDELLDKWTYNSLSSVSNLSAIEENSVVSTSRPSSPSGQSAQARPVRKHKIRVMPITKIVDAPLQISIIPKENDTVYTQTGSSYTLENELGKGGEGCTYEIVENDSVAKIYNKMHCTTRRRAKIETFITSKLQYEGICLPQAMLYNSAHEFVGYMMPKAHGRPLDHLLRSQPLFLERFPDWKKRDMVKLAITILKKIKYLHDHDVIIGDINPNNILVESPDEAYLVDTDSYQIDGFPCPVGTIYFTAPEIQGLHYPDFMRTQGNEDFAVATLLFMLMLQGKAPYSHYEGASPAENIRKGLFPYGVAGRSSTNVPPGLWRFIWSHLTRKLKLAFWDTFHSGGAHNTQETRYTVEDWLFLFNIYYYSLSPERMLSNDPMSNELFPTREKRSKNVEYCECRVCHDQVPKSNCVNGVCRDCREKMVNEVEETRKCISCGQSFIITKGEAEYFRYKGYELPKRCPLCRAKRKNERNAANPGIDWSTL